MTFDRITYITKDGRVITLREPDDHVLELVIEGQVIARFTQTDQYYNQSVSRTEKSLQLMVSSWLNTR